MVDQQEKNEEAKSAEPTTYMRPSERMFRRSRAAEARRRISERKDERFMRLVFGIAGFAALLAFLFFYMFAQTAQAAEATEENIPNERWTQPFLGNFSIIDLAGIAFVAVTGYAVWRKYTSSGKE